MYYLNTCKSFCSVNFYLFSFSVSAVLFAMGDFIAQKTAAGKTSSLDDKVLYTVLIKFSLFFKLGECFFFFLIKK